MNMKRSFCALIILIYASLFFILLFYNSIGPNEITRTDENFNSETNETFESVDSFVLNIVKIGGNESDRSVKTDRRFLQDLGMCNIPKLEMNGTEVIKFYKKIAPLDCQSGQPNPWVYIDEHRRIQATEYANREFGLDNINCTWTFYERLNDRYLEWTPEENFTFGETVEKGDFMKISCHAGEKQWSNPFMVVVPKLQRVVELRQIRQKRASSNTPLNVYILSFDSLSQMSFRRNLPKTVKLLEDELKLVVFNGYNIVGDGTPQAFIPILTAQTEEELPLTRKRYSKANFVDDVYPFAWRNFSDNGYATLYGEDGHSLGTFTYRLKGFRETPTDHYPITFFHYSESIQKTNLCVGSEKQHNVWFRYIESFWREYSNLEIPRFSLMHHSCLSHDDINRVQLADEDIVNHLKEMQRMGAFNDTLVIVMADHGARFSEIRKTHQGQLEERLPFFSVYLPSNQNEASQLAWVNLRKNAKDRLVTPFDVHATLMDVLRWPLPSHELHLLNALPQHNIIADGKPPKLKYFPPPNRSLSFFREIPLNRTCAQAGIEPHWCTCLAWKHVINTREVKSLARAVVKLINEYTEPERKFCAPLKLHRVETAKKLVPNDNLLKYNGVVDKDGFVPEFKGNTKVAFATYQIVFKTSPGNAEYEVTLFYNGTQVTVDWSAISHINKYGDTPHCIIDRNYFMATYCVCYDRINSTKEKIY